MWWHSSLYLNPGKNSLKKKIDKLETVSESKDGMIKVTVKGTSNIQSIKINDDFLANISSKDLEKNLIKTVNDALNNAEKSSKQIMSEMTGGLNIPGL